MLHVGRCSRCFSTSAPTGSGSPRPGVSLVRERAIAGDADRRLLVLLLVTVIPAGIVGVLFNDVIEREVRSVGSSW